MDLNRQASPSSLYLPLVGQEHAIRLEEKFSHVLSSDEDSEIIYSTFDENNSHGNLGASSSSKWLNSNNGKNECESHGKRKQKLTANKKRYNSISKTSSTNKQNENSTCLPDTAKCSSNYKLFPDKILDSINITADNKSRCSIESKKEDEVTNDWNDGGVSLIDSERPKLAIMPVSDKVELRLSNDDTQPLVAVPATISQYLRDYQKEGIQFLYEHYTAKTGAILGDDMGLGKTIQVIGFLSSLLGKQGNRLDNIRNIPKFIRQMSDDIPSTPPRKACNPFLIIGPTAVMYNWLDELKVWGYFSASKFHGADKETCLDNIRKKKLEIVVTTFETFRDNIGTLNQVVWEAVIVDEVHKIKGLKAQVTQALRSIKTPCRFGLTGTALQNNMTELWSLLDWAQPGILGTLDQFERKFVEVIELGQRHDATKRELAQARRQKEKFSEIRKKIMLRRTKSLIADQLPSKEDLVVMCRLSDLQISVYKAILTHPDMQLVLCAEDVCNCGSGKARASCCYKKSTDGTKLWTLVFSFMHLLLKAANHLALLIPDKKTKEKQANLAKRVCEVAFKNYPHFVEQTQAAVSRTLSDPQYCGKMKVLQGLLSAFYANHDKVLIFSYSTRLLDTIEQYVIGQGHAYRRIDGKVGSLQRQNIVVQFNQDNNIFLCLISTKSGSLGLNLTGANKVVIFDPNWNPSHDLQAQDRAYRIGQTRDVKVYRLVSAGTIEENIYLRQIYKQQLDEVVIGTSNARRYFHGIQGDKSNHGELFGIKNMFSLRTGNSCLTMDILKRNDKIERGLAGYDITRYIPSNRLSSLNSAESSDEGSDRSDNESYVDTDAEIEEDEEFLREMFGSERSPIIVQKPSQGSKIFSESISNNVHQESTKLFNVHTSSAAIIDSDSNNGDISLIPTLYKKYSDATFKSGRHEALAFDSYLPSLKKSMPSLSKTKDSVSHDKGSDITILSKPGQISDVHIQQQSKTAKTTRKSGALSGISWLFSDSDDDDDDDDDDNDDHNENNKNEDVEMVFTNTRTFNFRKDKDNLYRSDVTKSIQEVNKNSVCDVKGSLGLHENSSIEKCNDQTESSKKTRIQIGTAKKDALLEHLILSE